MSTVAQLSPTTLAADPSGRRVLDVRKPAEITAGRIPDISNISPTQPAARLGELDRETMIMTACRSGRRSQAAAEALAAAAFAVADLAGRSGLWTATSRSTA